LSGRVGAIDVSLESAASEKGELRVNAELVDPRSLVKGVMVHVAPTSDRKSAVPYTDGSWPPLPNTQGVELIHDTKTASATGRVPINLPGQSAAARRCLIQTASRYQSGQLVYSKPEEYYLPRKPGQLFPIGASLERIVKASRRASSALLGRMIDSDKD